ncbi:MAG: ATP-dependent acyl-CoA ligase [Rhodospirillaceae bacterium]|nr:ATP-dependent acyl-CoA ligase [Rhodospirillaceae bacterium]MYB14839.1 ATP-dependent acyl-CoA ligase [Rhodospirillaceae bacterium]MYI50226.1 ATP-dependent acyl-CoA ligase [Rhodospirillaceae bacterium]
MRRIESPLVHPFAGFDIPALVAARAASHPDKPFLIWEPFAGPRASWTFAEFAHEVDRVAAGLAARDIKAGDSVLVHLDNCPEILFAWFACAKIGAICVTTNARSAADEMTYFADHSGAVAAITQPKFAAMVGGACKDLRWVAVTDTDNGEAPAPGSGPGSGPGGDSFARLAGDPADAPRRPADPMAPLSVQFTSGTTSRPKAVLWLHGNGLWGAKINALHEDLRETDCHLTYLPLFHANAQAYSALASLWVGAGCVVQPRFSARRFWDVAIRNGCTWTSMVPFMNRALMDHDVPERHPIRLMGNGICSPPTDEIFGVKTIGWWGMTETVSHGFVGDVHLPNRPLSVGKPSVEYDIRVLNEAGDPVGPDETGDLFVRGVRGISMFAEYLGNEEATAEAFDDEGFFTTGDKITVHSDGFCSFSDRAKDMLKVGGENVAASEVERVIAEQPLAREVAVVAKKHPMLDEVPVAYILVDGGAAKAPPDYGERIIAACRQSLADFKVPTEVRLVDDFPRSTIEKIAKNVLRAELEAERTGDAES